MAKTEVKQSVSPDNAEVFTRECNFGSVREAKERVRWYRTSENNV